MLVSIPPLTFKSGTETEPPLFNTYCSDPSFFTTRCNIDPGTLQAAGSRVNTMKRSDLNLNPIRRTVAATPSRFSTFDMIEYPEMAQLNKRIAAERNYKAEVGKQLKELMGELGKTEVQSKTSRGSIWEKRNPA